MENEVTEFKTEPNGKGVAMSKAKDNLLDGNTSEENAVTSDDQVTSSSHHHECDCNGDHHSNHDGDHCDCESHDHDVQDSVTLELEDGSELICPIIDLFEVEGKEYIAVFNPIEEVALIYHFFDYEDGTVELTSLDEEGEYERVYDRFKALQEEVED